VVEAEVEAEAEVETEVEAVTSPPASTVPTTAPKCGRSAATVTVGCQCRGLADDSFRFTTP